MPNIYDGIKKMSDSEIRTQIAMLRNMNVVNVAKETGNRLLGGLTNLANAFSETFSRKTPFEYQVTGVSDMINQEILKLRDKERIQLEFELKKVLMERCNELLSKPMDMEMGEERLCYVLVSEAAKTYGMEKYLTQGRKIEEIKDQYQKSYLQTLHNILIHQTEEEKTKTDQAIQKRMNEVPMETKRDLQKSLMPKEFSGRGIARILRLERSTKYLSMTVMLLGSDCFEYVNTNVTAIRNTVKGLKRITRVLLAQFVWAAANAYGERFVLSDDILPGYIKATDREEQQIKEKTFRVMLLERQKAEKELEKCDIALEKLDLQIADLKDRYELESREYDEAQMKFMGLESKKDDYMNGNHAQDETKVYYADVNESKRKLDSAQSGFNKSKNKLNETVAHKKKLESERNTALINYEVSKHKTDAEINIFAQILKTNWQAFYYKFQFDDALFEKVIIEFTKEEQLRIEEMLKEMHDSRDMSAYAIDTEQIDDIVDDAGNDTVKDTADDNGNHNGNGPQADLNQTDTSQDDASHEEDDQKETQETTQETTEKTTEGTAEKTTEETTEKTTEETTQQTTQETTQHLGYITYVSVATGKDAYIKFYDQMITDIGKN